MSVCICMCTNMFVHLRAYVHVCTHNCACVYLNPVPVCLCMHDLCMHASACLHVCVAMRAQARSRWVQVGCRAHPGRQQQKAGSGGRKQSGQVAYLHGDATIWALVPKGATLLFEGDEIPNSNDRVLRDVEMKEFDAGKGAEGTELAWCAGEVVSYEEPICRRDSRDSQCEGQEKLQLSQG